MAKKKKTSRKAKASLPETRDAFLSHSSRNKKIVREVAAKIETDDSDDRQLYTWLDEAEIKKGQSIVGAIDKGLDNSDFFIIFMSPDYFSAGSGWTDAEWHAALHNDPDNRIGKIVTVLIEDCPFIPPLLRHLNFIDMRGNRLETGIEELIATIRDEPLPRPSTYRGQLVTPGQNIDRASLIAERSVPEAFPDAANERLYCNLFPLKNIPEVLYVASISLTVDSKKGPIVCKDKRTLIDEVHSHLQTLGFEKIFTPAFRVVRDQIYTFHDLEDPDTPFGSIIDLESIEYIETTDMLLEEDDRRIVISLLNMAVGRHACRAGLVGDNLRQNRYYFPPTKGGENKIQWRAKRKKSTRNVAKPVKDKEGNVRFWLHQAAYLNIIFLANNLFLLVRPTRVATSDGLKVLEGPKVNKLVNPWISSERNLHVLFHVRFWAAVLGMGRNRISVHCGDDNCEISAVPAFVDQSYGIKGDQSDLMGELDQEAYLIAADEEKMIDQLGAEI